MRILNVVFPRIALVATLMVTVVMAFFAVGVVGNFEISRQWLAQIMWGGAIAGTIIAISGFAEFYDIFLKKGWRSVHTLLIWLTSLLFGIGACVSALGTQTSARFVLANWANAFVALMIMQVTILSFPEMWRYFGHTSEDAEHIAPEQKIPDEQEE